MPALGALIAEPLFLLADSAIVGHLGTVELAGLAFAATVLSTVVGLSVFLAYGATAAVARKIGAGDHAGALAHGIDGLWLATLIGLILLAIGTPTAGLLIEWLGGHGAVAGQGTTYLRWSMAGLPAMLVVLAGTGVLRGLQETRPPLIVAGIGAVVNVGLNLLLVYGLAWGIAGSAIGTVIVQWCMAIALTAYVVRAARRYRVGLAPNAGRVRRAGRSGLPVLLRTLSLRTAVVLSVVVGARQGTVVVAGLLVTMNIWNLLALALDAIAIAAQALTGKALGAGDASAARSLTRQMLRWGLLAGLVLAGVLAAAAPFVGSVFSTDPAVVGAVTAALLVLAAGQILSGWVFILDGVLLGAGDGGYLAWTGLLNLLSYLPALLLLALAGPGGRAGLVWLWAAYIGVYMTSRAITLGLRYRGSRWLVLGTAG